MSEFEPVGGLVGEVLRSVESAREAYLRKRLRVIPTLCVECPIDSPQMRTCSFSTDSECKHRPTLDLRQRANGHAARCKAAKVPPKYHAEVSAIEACSALSAVHQVLAGELQAAILLGTVGSGKTLCASFALAERGGLFCPASSLDVLSAEASALTERLCSEPMVVLDDVGRGRSATVMALDRTEEILCRRSDGGLPTIVTANLTRPEFWKLHAIGSGRVKDRIGEQAIIPCREPSRRIGATEEIAPEIEPARANPKPFNERGEKP